MAQFMDTSPGYVPEYPMSDANDTIKWMRSCGKRFFKDIGDASNPPLLLAVIMVLQLFTYLFQPMSVQISCYVQAIYRKKIPELLALLE